MSAGGESPVAGMRLPLLRRALEVTRQFGLIAPGDPVRYDFALTRLGMRGLLRSREFPGIPAASV